MRKFTWLGFEIRPLSIQDILWLIIFAAIIVLSKFYPDIKVRVWVRSKYLWVCDSFTNVYPFRIKISRCVFSLVWILLFLGLLINHLTNLIYAPITMFFIYHIVRYVFWKKTQPGIYTDVGRQRITNVKVPQQD
jgi:hypothetical protein